MTNTIININPIRITINRNQAIVLRNNNCNISSFTFIVISRSINAVSSIDISSSFRNNIDESMNHANQIIPIKNTRQDENICNSNPINNTIIQIK